jgi:hypothetical protein
MVSVVSVHHGGKGMMEQLTSWWMDRKQSRKVTGKGQGKMSPRTASQ